jgi:hypothetical protein
MNKKQNGRGRFLPLLSLPLSSFTEQKNGERFVLFENALFIVVVGKLNQI